MPLFGVKIPNSGIYCINVWLFCSFFIYLQRLDTITSMEKENTLLQQVNKCLLAEYINASNMPSELLDKVKGAFVSSNKFSSYLINVKAETAIHISEKTLDEIGNIESNTSIDVIPFSDWRKTVSESFLYEYDRERFDRSTEIGRLRRKVLEHQRYSFVAHTKDDESHVCVEKYDFVVLDSEAKYILSTQQEITHSLEHDILTGGLNRAGLIRELQLKFEAISTIGPCSLLYFNIQNFRVINELHGEEVGDKVLQFMYTSIVYSELNPISYARIDSDNFVCLVLDTQLNTEVISKLCHLEYADDQYKIPFRSVCGIYHVADKDETPVNAYNRAKLATSYIKNSYIQPWMAFEPSMQKTYFSDNEILKQLDSAIANKEFVPFFQPIVNTQTGRIEMAEALVRWMSPTKGMVPPGVFIPVLERHGGLSRIDMVMEEHVFEMQKKRYKEGLPIVPIDINLSWVDFADNQLLDQLYKHILDEGLPTDMLRYEITESALSDIAENRYDVLDFFKVQHVKLLIDDFGQAYSFGTMKDVDFAIIKIDKSMIDQIGSSRKVNLLIETMINMFHKMHAKVVAEGVETEMQVEYLKQVGCDYIQGFHFFRPMDEKAFIELLAHNEQTHSNVLAESGAKVVKAEDPKTKEIVAEKPISRLKSKVKQKKSIFNLFKLSDFKSTLLIVATCTVLAAAIYFTTYQLVYQLVTDNCDELTSRDIDKIKLNVDLELNSAQEALQTFSTTVFKNGLDIPKSEEEIYLQMERFLANTPFLSGIVAGFEDSVFPEYADQLGFGPLVRKVDGELIRYQVGEIRDFRHTKEWYSEAFDQKQARWSSPFFSEEGDIIIDYCIPLFNAQNEVVGVVACDLSISHLHQVTENIKPYPMSNVMIMQKDLTFVIHPEKGYPMHKTLPVYLKERGVPQVDSLLINALINGEKGKRIHGKDNENVFLYYDVIEKADYRLLIESQSADVYNSLNDISSTLKLIGFSGLALLMAVLGFMIYDNKKRERRDVERNMEILRHSAETDGLTGIFNRTAGEKLISGLIESRQPGILAILDCDKFKLVNDNYGHATGDQLLRMMAETIRTCFANDIVLRLGGDEFAVFCSANTPAQFELKVQNFFVEVKELRIDGMGDYSPSVSMGAAVYHGEEDIAFDRLYTKADRLLYESKRTEGCALTISEH